MKPSVFLTISAEEPMFKRIQAFLRPDPKHRDAIRRAREFLLASKGKKVKRSSVLAETDEGIIVRMSYGPHFRRVYYCVAESCIRELQLDAVQQFGERATR